MVFPTGKQTFGGMSIGIILTFVFVGIYVGMENSLTRTGSLPTSVKSDWNGETSVTLTKRLSSQWNWRYSDDDRKVVQLCPSWRHDAGFYANDVLVGTSDAKIASLRSTSYLLDYTGFSQYISEAGDPWDALINGVRITISMQISNATTNSVIAYVAGSTFVNDDFWILSTKGEKLVRMQRNKITLSEWEWVLTQTGNNTLPLYVPALIAGHHSFSDNDNTDGCNMFAMAAFYLAIIFGVLTLIGVFFVTYMCLKNNSNQWSS